MLKDTTEEAGKILAELSVRKRERQGKYDRVSTPTEVIVEYLQSASARAQLSALSPAHRQQLDLETPQCIQAC